MTKRRNLGKREHALILVVYSKENPLQSKDSEKEAKKKLNAEEPHGNFSIVISIIGTKAKYL